MSEIHRRSLPLLLQAVLAVLLVCTACSVKKNNAPTRFYHNLTTRYNVYYHADRLFDETYLRIVEGVSENYTEPIALDPITYSLRDRQTTSTTSLGLFDQSLKKADKAIREHSLRTKPPKSTGWHRDPKQVKAQQLTEYNNVLYHAWLLRGISQLYNGNVEEAHATFDYMTRLYATQEDIRVSAMLWQIRCLNLSGRSVAAKELFARIDTTWTNSPLYLQARAEYHLSMSEYKDGVIWLERYVVDARPKAQRIRLYYLLGQIYQILGEKKKACEAYNKVLRLSPSPALEFAARLRHAELLPKGSSSVQNTLITLARKSKYRSHLDQIYYALGRSYLEDRDTLRAMNAFAISADSSQSKGLDYALAHIARGDIYLKHRRYVLAGESYEQALNALPKSDNRYMSIRKLAEGLGFVRPFASVIHEGDSLLYLARSSEEYRSNVIDSVIRQKKKVNEDRQRQRQRDSISEVNRSISSSLPGIGSMTRETSLSRGNGMLQGGRNNKFYFYNPDLLHQGQKEFERIWGHRPLVDLWRLSKHFNVISTTIDTTFGSKDIERKDPLSDTFSDAIEAEKGLDDPYRREYYLSRLPLSIEKQRSLEKDIERNILELGKGLNLRLDLFDDAIHVYKEYLRRYPYGVARSDVLYQLFVLHLRLGRSAQADSYRHMYLKEFPESALAKEISQENYMELLRQRKQVPVDIYQTAYDAYWRADLQSLRDAYCSLEESYPNSEYSYRARFLFAMGLMAEGSIDEALSEMKLVSGSDAPEELVTLSRHIMEGVASGRSVFSGHYKPTEWGIIASDEFADIEGQKEEVQRVDRAISFLLIAPRGLPSDLLVYHLSMYHYTVYTQQIIPVRVLKNTLNTSIVVVGNFQSVDLAKVYADGWRRYTKQTSELEKSLLIPVYASQVNRLDNAEAIQSYLEQKRVNFDTLFSDTLRAMAMGFLRTIDVQPSDNRILSTQIDERNITSEGQIDIQESPFNNETISTPLSYEEAMDRARQNEKRRKEEQKLRERDRKLRQKLRLKERREIQNTKERDRKARVRERTKRAKEKERSKLTKSKQ